MDTQILTLFGDEDFQAPPPSKKPGKKEQPEDKAEEEKPEPAPAPAPAKNNASLSYDAPSIADKKREFVIGNSYVEPVTVSDTEIPKAANANDIVEDVDSAKTNSEEIAETEVPEPNIEKDTEKPQPVGNTLPGDISESKTETTHVEDATTLDTEMRIALLQNDYAGYFHREKPSSPTTTANKSSIVFEGIVTPKKNTEPIIPKDESQPEEETIEEEVASMAEPLPEFELESRYYSIGEVAKLFQVNNSHIRFWTNEFKLKPRTTRKGDRLYNAEDIATLRLIHHLVKEKGHTIKGAREKMKQKETVEVNLDLSESLLKLKEMLTEMKNQL